jgi:hypothetical protein
VLFNIAYGLRQAKIGADAADMIERRAIELSEARAEGVIEGSIGAELVPDELEASYHASGHLARVRVWIDDLHNGELVLAAKPGSGSFSIIEKRGGYGTMIREDYRGGGVVTTLNTPWHDGEESTETKPWTLWVMQNLADLARLARAGKNKARKGKGKGRKGRKGR